MLSKASVLANEETKTLNRLIQEKIFQPSEETGVGESEAEAKLPDPTLTIFESHLFCQFTKSGYDITEAEVLYAARQSKYV